MRSTAKTMLALNRPVLGAQNISEDTKSAFAVFCKATIITVNLTQTKIKLEGSDELTRTCSTIANILDKIKAIGTSSTKMLYDQYRGEYDNLLKKVNEDSSKRISLLSTFQDLESSIIRDLRALIIKILGASNVDSMSSSLDVKNTLLNLEKKGASIVAPTNTLNNNEEKNKDVATHLKASAVKNLPIEVQKIFTQPGHIPTLNQ